MATGKNRYGCFFFAMSAVAICWRSPRRLAFTLRSFSSPMRTMIFWPEDIDSSLGSAYS